VIDQLMPIMNAQTGFYTANPEGAPPK
jgi:hypothetical protein